MKAFYSVIIISLSALASCGYLISPVTISTVEITKIVLITTTPIATSTLSPTLTPKQSEISDTRVTDAIGTPIKASYCYKATDMQSDINNCSNQRRMELELQMSDLFDKVEERYKVIYGDSSVFSQFQAEWNDLTIRECKFRSGRDAIDSGSMALTDNNECLVAKYEARLRELQILLYEMNI